MPEAVAAQRSTAPPLETWAPTISSWSLSDRLNEVDLDLKDRARRNTLPWRGQFSPETVDRLLEALCPEGARVLDPFVGSGTTLVEAARHGCKSVGMDINPAAVALARAATWSGLSPEDREQRMAALRHAVEAGVAVRGPELTDLHTVALLAMSATDLGPGLKKLSDFVDALPETPVECLARLGDARATGLEPDSVEFVLTSPPYINVVNYHQHGRPLTDEFGWPVLTAARKEIGSNRQNRSNRFRTVMQYSVDMALTLLEMTRVVSPGGTLVLIVGRESRVRGVPFCNSEILARLIETISSLSPEGRGERKFVNRYGTTVYEDVLVVTRGGQVEEAVEDDVRASGLSTGKGQLVEAVCSDPVAAKEIETAIAEADRIEPSGMAL